MINKGTINIFTWGAVKAESLEPQGHLTKIKGGSRFVRWYTLRVLMCLHKLHLQFTLRTAKIQHFFRLKFSV